MSTARTTSLPPLTEPSLNLTQFFDLTKVDPMHLRFAMERTRFFFRLYPNAQASDASTYVMAVSALLSEYSVEVVTRVTDPCGTLARTSRFLPSIAEFFEACETTKKALTPPLVRPLHGEVMAEKHLHPLLFSAHRGKVFVQGDSPEWDAWVIYTAQHFQKPFHPIMFGGWTFPTQWPPGREPQPVQHKTEAKKCPV